MNNKNIHLNSSAWTLFKHRGIQEVYLSLIKQESLPFLSCCVPTWRFPCVIYFANDEALGRFLAQLSASSSSCQQRECEALLLSGMSDEDRSQVTAFLAPGLWRGVSWCAKGNWTDPMSAWCVSILWVSCLMSRVFRFPMEKEVLDSHHIKRNVHIDHVTQKNDSL